MRVAIMQPYFLPYIGYFQLIAATERFILFDDVQYIRHGWINRNRILKPNEGWQYIIVPLQEHSNHSLIKNINVLSGTDWKTKILRQIEHYKKKAPFYVETKQLLETCFENPEMNIAKANGSYLKNICAYINLPFKVELSSEMHFDYSGVKDAGDWALEISTQIGATEYINPIGGQELFSYEKYEQKNIRLKFLKSNSTDYNQRRLGSFEPGLSILDVLMFNSPEEIRTLLNTYDII